MTVQNRMATTTNNAATLLVRIGVIVIAFACICWCIICKLNKPSFATNSQNRFLAAIFNLRFDVHRTRPTDRPNVAGTSFDAIIKSTEYNFLHYAMERTACECVCVFRMAHWLPFGAFTGNRFAFCSAWTQRTNGNKFLI